MVLVHGLKKNMTLMSLLLHGNRLGRHGARALLRLYAEGEDETVVGMDDVDLDNDETDVYDPANPSGSYTLNLSNSIYDRMVSEMIYVQANTRFGFEISGVEHTAGPAVPGGKQGARTKLQLKRKELAPEKMLKGRVGRLQLNGKRWVLPNTGKLCLTVQCIPRPVSEAVGITDDGLSRMLDIIYSNSSSQHHRMKLLKLASEDMYLTTKQAERILLGLPESFEKVLFILLKTAVPAHSS
jgi:hypothetical protein